MATLWRARAIKRIDGQAIALEDHDVLEVIGECARRRQATHASADYDCLPANELWHYRSSLTMPDVVSCPDP